MVSMSVSLALIPNQMKDYKIGICWFSCKQSIIIYEVRQMVYWYSEDKVLFLPVDCYYSQLAL